MAFEGIIGNDDLKRALSGMIAGNRVPHAMMLYENEGCGALAIVMEFLKELNKGHHPDVHYTFPITSGTKVKGEVKNLVCDMFLQLWLELAGKNPYFLESELSEALGFEKKKGLIAVAEGKAIIQKLSLTSLSDGYRSIVIWLPERMNAETANKLLKAIEEPAPNDLFILITHSPSSVLQTISSRCQALRVLPLSKEEVCRTLEQRFGYSHEDASFAAAFSSGSVGEALYALSRREETSATRELFFTLMENIVSRDYLATLETGDVIASMDSREKQKAFCNFAGECIRKIFMLQQGLEEISGIMPQERDFYVEMAGKCGRSFCRSSLDIIGRAAQRLERNVGQKIIFCNMVSRMFGSVRQ
ncbi:MAG: hypothetical protein IJV54_12025 [Bacteroidales bacterium]|nr:hypothetical protein [Bacteroidales bacterium]MBQ9713002.1 hypothetical protein [Bacteroidales bacterium]MBR1433567.1 hypothetical protein [Bacteroidales bacterium]